jgi:ribosomal peptide maturation radical SAM protein 1
LKSEWWKSADAIEGLIGKLDDEFEAWLDQSRVDTYDVVGLTMVFEQTLSAVALARKIKARRHDSVIVCGGAACEGEMGRGLLTAYPWLDFAISGDGEPAVPALISALRGERQLATVPGLSFRVNGHVQTNAQAPLKDLDESPAPDFVDYFQQLKASPLKRAIPHPAIPFETSRGCWWGQKHLCTFCGLNGTSLAFRRKSAGRVVDELTHHVEQFACTSLIGTDNILDLGAFSGWVRSLAAWQEAAGCDLTIFFEIKSNLKRQQIRDLYKAGVRVVQPGIESFSDAVLTRMDKGATGIQQIQCLKWLDEEGIQPIYNLIVCNPGDTERDYGYMAALTPFLSHLFPPAPPIPMMLQRFSPYFMSPEKFGISNVRPARMLVAAHRAPEEVVSQMAYSFEFDHLEVAALRESAGLRSLQTAVDSWRNGYVQSRLTYASGPGFVKVLDRREGKPRTIVLRGFSAMVFKHCDAHRSMASIFDLAPSAERAQVEQIVADLVGAKLMFRDPADRVIALPIKRPMPLN